MKLLLCLKCSDIVSLQREHRECKCGDSGGKYLQDGLNAIHYGGSMLLGFHNGSLALAVSAQAREGDSFETFGAGYYTGHVKGREFVAFIIPQSAPTVKWFETKEEYDSEN